MHRGSLLPLLLLLLLLNLLGPSQAAPATPLFENMNGEYLVTATPGQRAEGNFSTVWHEYSNDATPPGVDYFEVYLGPMTTLYSQVWWKELPTQPLPPALVKKLDGKAIAIVGYEVDQVRKTPEGDVSVPINMHYSKVTALP
jgi:hypothetical protein